MELTDDDVVQILKLLNDSSFDELQLEMDNLKLVVRRGGNAVSIQELEPGFTRPIDLAPPKEPAVAEKVQDTAAGICALPDTAIAPTKIGTVEEAGLVAIMASSVGTFYRAPKPGAPPFVDVGTFVTEDDTVCLLEVMKCFISVKARVRGYVAKICTENAQMVEFGQELFLVKLTENSEEAPSYGEDFAGSDRKSG